jgi:dihydroorotase
MGAGIANGPGPRRTLFEGGDIVTPEEIRRADLLIDETGRIAAVGPDLAGNGAVTPETLRTDVRGKMLFPGALDMHVHFRDPLPSNPAETLASGSRAAVAGGVVGFADMPNTAPPTNSPEALADKLALAGRESIADYSFYVCMPLAAADRARLADLDATTFPGFKVYLGGTTGAERLPDDVIEDGFRLAARHGVPATVHSEDDDRIAANAARLADELDTDPTIHARIRDAESCAASTARAIELVRQTGAHLHVAHVTTAAEVAQIAAAQDEGLPVTGEVTLHHLFLDDSDYARLGHKIKCNPSIKSAADREGLWAGLRNGTLAMVATDHAPHPLESKLGRYEQAPAGVPGVELVLPLLLNEAVEGRIAFTDIARWTAHAPATLFRIRGKGRLAPGFDADLVVVDPTGSRELTAADVRSGAGYSPWEGTRLPARPLLTFVRGRVAHASATTLGELPAGRPLRFR